MPSSTWPSTVIWKSPMAASAGSGKTNVLPTAAARIEETLRHMNGGHIAFDGRLDAVQLYVHGLTDQAHGRLDWDRRVGRFLRQGAQRRQHKQQQAEQRKQRPASGMGKSRREHEIAPFGADWGRENTAAVILGRM
ncbi:MAG: hypothetical protein R2856_35875 [Caldilineaceae bacterium]